MVYQATTATQKIFHLNKRVRGISGGTSASKTISILIWIIDYAQSTENEMISVVSETLPHLKKGAIRDFKSIMEEQGYWNDARWNKTESTYLFDKGTQLEFFSAESADKVRGPRRDILFINEANNITFETFTQLEVRTKKVIWLDWNPVSEFWWYTEVLPHQDVDFLTLTYKDNESLDPSIIQSIESKQHNKAFWKVYGLGELGDSDTKIYNGWNIIDEIPHEARLERRGIDFGYTNDPTAIVDVYKYNGGLILDEILYRKGLSNRDIANFILALPYALCVADSAEPKSIDELTSYGVTVVPAKKGKDSVVHGIQYVQQQRVSLTKHSVNGIKEYRNYLWMTDKDGKIINVPEGVWNHFMDGGRYAITDMNPEFEKEVSKPQWAQKVPTWSSQSKVQKATPFRVGRRIPLPS